MNSSLYIIKKDTIINNINFMDILNNRYSEEDIENLNKKKKTTRTIKSTVFNGVNPNNEAVVKGCYDALVLFYNTFETIINTEDLSVYYDTFFIPKKSGGLRRIDAPKEELATAQRMLVEIFKNNFWMSYHDRAYAYIEERSVIDAVKEHQRNDSMWFLKTDFDNFFGSTTKEFVMNMMNIIYPFNEVLKNDERKELMSKVLNICFLNGGLPQGTPISPFITNMMMIPFDYEFNEFVSKKNMIYTRYADDILVSCKDSFRFKDVVDKINIILANFNAPFRIKDKKTRYGSRNGSNWNLGLMLNKDNKITLGHEKRRRFKAMIFSYCMDKKNGIRWENEDVYHMNGMISWFHAVDANDTENIIKNIELKTGIDLKKSVHADLYE